MRFLCTLILFISTASAVHAEMIPYANAEAGVEAYDYDTTYHSWVDIKFKNSGTVYRYPRTKFGQPAIDMMIELAKQGDGLTTYINSLPRQNQRRKQELPTIVYCGERGGYPKEEWWRFPIKTRGQARAALAYAHWAPKPDGIRDCVCEHFPTFPSCKRE